MSTTSKKIKKTILTESDYYLIKELYEESESYTHEEFKKVINEQFECETLKEDLINSNICPECHCEMECKINGFTSYEVWGTWQVHNEYKTYCPNCGYVKE